MKTIIYILFSSFAFTQYNITFLVKNDLLPISNGQLLGPQNEVLAITNSIGKANLEKTKENTSYLFVHPYYNHFSFKIFSDTVFYIDEINTQNIEEVNVVVGKNRSSCYDAYKEVLQKTSHIANNTEVGYKGRITRENWLITQSGIQNDTLREVFECELTMIPNKNGGFKYYASNPIRYVELNGIPNNLGGFRDLSGLLRIESILNYDFKNTKRYERPEKNWEGSIKKDSISKILFNKKSEKFNEVNTIYYNTDSLILNWTNNTYQYKPMATKSVSLQISYDYKAIQHQLKDAYYLLENASAEKKAVMSVSKSEEKLITNVQTMTFKVDDFFQDLNSPQGQLVDNWSEYISSLPISNEVIKVYIKPVSL